jgi:hypothetical protein
MSASPNLEPVAVLVVAGPYLAIFLASSLGAYYRLTQRDDTRDNAGEGDAAPGPATPRRNALGFFAAVNTGALLFTVPLSKLAQAYLPGVDANWLLVPLAFGLGLLGERWPAVGNWAARRAGRVLDVLLRNKTGGSP